MLTLAFQSGEKGSYQAIYDRYAARVHGVCRRMLNNPQDAQEAAQEAFLRIYQALGRFNGRYQLGPWVTRIATNVCLDHLRAQARRGTGAAPLDIVEVDPVMETDDSDPQVMVIRNAEGRRVRKVLTDLSPLHRAAIVLRDFEGLTYQEVAHVLQMSDSQVKALIHRARKSFKRAWSGSGLAAFLPWRLLSRIRMEAPAREHAAQAFVTSAQVAPACTSVFQQCGQYLAERVAPVVAAALVGAAATAVASPAVRDAKPAGAMPSENGSRLKEAEFDPAGAETKSVKQAVEKEGTTEADPQAPIADPAASPSPMPVEEPTEASDGETGESDQGTDPQGSSATPPFTPSIGFDWGRPVPGRTPTTYSSEVTCEALTIEHRVDTQVDDDDSPVTYPARLFLHYSDGGELSLELTVWKNGNEVYYSGSGREQQSNRNPEHIDIQFMGEYATLNPAARNMDLPESGDFSVSLGLDCRSLAVVTESVLLSAQ